MAKFIVILGFILAFAAGMVIGSRRALVPEAPTSPTPSATSAPSAKGPDRRGPGGWLSSELGLSDAQRKSLDGIWSAVAKANDQDERRRNYRRERDEAIAHLVPPERLDEYDSVINIFTDRIDALERSSREAYESAVEQTKQILTPEQRVRYEDLLKRHRWGPGVRDRHAGHRGETRATSQPDRADAPSSSPSHD
jgi:Spy/CpxP family protein refolding chaperone